MLLIPIKNVEEAELYWDNQTGKLNITAILQASTEKDKKAALDFLLKYFGYSLAQTG